MTCKKSTQTTIDDPQAGEGMYWDGVDSWDDGPLDLDIAEAVTGTLPLNNVDSGFVRLAGKSLGQTIIGGTGSGEDLVLETTSHGTKGSYFFAEDSSGTLLDCEADGDKLGITAAGVLKCDANPGGGSETNTLETDVPPNVENDQVFIGTGNGTGTWMDIPDCNNTTEKLDWNAGVPACVTDQTAGGVSEDAIGTTELDDGADTPGSGEYIRVDTGDQAGIEYRTDAEVLGDIGAAASTHGHTLAGVDFVDQGTTTTVLHGNASGNPAFGAVTSSDVDTSICKANGDDCDATQAELDALFSVAVTGFQIIIPNPVADQEYVLMLPPFTGTMTRIDCESFGGTSVTINLCDGEDIGDTDCTVSILDADETTELECTNSPTPDTGLNATGFEAYDKVSLVLAAVDGSVDQLTVMLTVTVD
jgi:hypothetical protein